jgi:hypothetical protein
MVSWVFLGQTIEFEHNLPPENVVQSPSVLKDSLRILNENVPFRWFIISRLVAQFCMMGFAFYIIYTVRVLG